MKKTRKLAQACCCLISALCIVSFSIPPQAVALKSLITKISDNAFITDEQLSARLPDDSFYEHKISIMALGDNLMHMGIVNTGRLSGGGYNYDFLFDDISEFLDTAEVKIINQETIMAGNQLGFSGYPKFNSPTQVADAIANVGFNVVLHATNHSADQGINGLKYCASYWEQYPEVLMLGISNEENSGADIPILEIDGVKIAVLNYTYGPNSSVFPASYRGHLNILCDYNDKTGAIDFTRLNPQVITDIQNARAAADIVIVCPHWGTEYAESPSSYQREFAQEMTDAGADVIIGTHPHVPEPVEWLTAPDGTKTLCYYSIGNYVSTQQNLLSMLEGMAWVTFRVNNDGISIDEDETGVVPLVCHYSSSPVRLKGVYPLEDYTEAMAVSHGIKSYGGTTLHLSYLEQKTKDIFGDMTLSKSEILY